MRIWKWLLPVMILATPAGIYLDELRYIDEVRPEGFSTDTPAGSVFPVRLQRALNLRDVREGQTLRFITARAVPYGSETDASLPADAVLEARVKQVLTGPRGRRVIVFEFVRLKASGRRVPLAAFLTVRGETQNRDGDSSDEAHAMAGAHIARSVRDDPLVVLAGYLSGTYLGGFMSRRVEAPASFFSNEKGSVITPSTELRVQLHRRSFIPR